MAKNKEPRLPWNWRDRIEIIDDDDCSSSIIFIIQFKEDQSPDGFGRLIGSLSIEGDKPHMIENAWLDEKFRGRGLGRELYEHALIKLGIISTTFHEASGMAQRVWKSLIRDYKYDPNFWEQKLIVHHKKRRTNAK